MNWLIMYALSKKYADEVGQSILDAGFKTQVEQDRSILQTTGQEKILYFIPKTTAKPSDGYDEYVYSNNAWERVGATDVDLSSIDYDTLINKPQINGIPLSGNMALDYLGAQDQIYSEAPNAFPTAEHTTGDLFIWNNKIYRQTGTSWDQVIGTYVTYQTIGRRIGYSRNDPPNYEELTTVPSYNTGDLYVKRQSQPANALGDMTDAEVYICADVLLNAVPAATPKMRYSYIWTKIPLGATTLTGYGITDAYTKTETDAAIANTIQNNFFRAYLSPTTDILYDFDLLTPSVKNTGVYKINKTDITNLPQEFSDAGQILYISHYLSNTANSDIIRTVSYDSTDGVKMWIQLATLGNTNASGNTPIATETGWADLTSVGWQPVDISAATITLAENSYTYDGTVKTPTVASVVLNGQTLNVGTDYVVTMTPETNAGSYVVIVNGVGDYTGTAIANWTINKAQATISGANVISITVAGSTRTETYTTTGDGAMSFSISDSSVATISNSGGNVTVTAVSSGSATLTVTVADGANYLGATKTVEVSVVAYNVFGVVWDYSLSSPALARLTPQTDPLGVVTDCPTAEPTACVGITGGQSDFDNYMPWAGMVRKNYVNGEVVDFTGYDNGETFIYIPEFWNKLVDDTTNSKMYFYISSAELTGFTKHLGSGRYVGRYQCDSNFESKPNGYSKTNVSLADFRIGISSVNNNRFVYDVHTYMAIIMLYIVEWANLNSQEKIGYGVVSNSGNAKPLGETDTLIYHTGRASGINEESSIQYRWIENIYSNVWDFLDGILIDDGNVYICSDYKKYADSITNNYINDGIIMANSSGWIKNTQCLNNIYMFPKTVGGSNNTYLCDYVNSGSGLRCCLIGSAALLHLTSGGLFAIDFVNSPSFAHSTIGARAVFESGGAS